MTTAELIATYQEEAARVRAELEMFKRHLCPVCRAHLLGHYCTTCDWQVAVESPKGLVHTPAPTCDATGRLYAEMATAGSRAASRLRCGSGHSCPPV